MSEGGWIRTDCSGHLQSPGWAIGVTCLPKIRVFDCVGLLWWEEFFFVFASCFSMINENTRAKMSQKRHRDQAKVSCNQVFGRERHVQVMRTQTKKTTQAAKVVNVVWVYVWPGSLAVTLVVKIDFPDDHRTRPLLIFAVVDCLAVSRITAARLLPMSNFFFLFMFVFRLSTNCRKCRKNRENSTDIDSAISKREIQTWLKIRLIDFQLSVILKCDSIHWPSFATHTKPCFLALKLEH